MSKALRDVAAAIALWLRLIAICVLIQQAARADQVGIDKVRLFEAAGGQYLLEVDTTPRFIAAYRDPILPQRFELTESARQRQAGYVVLRYRFRSRGEPLLSEDELLLPWARSGASITVQWSDGSVQQQLFLRDFEGIRVPIQMLKRRQSSRRQIATENLQSGISHAARAWNHWLLVCAMALLACGRWRILLPLSFAAGHAIAMVFADLRAFVVTGEVSEVCIVVITLLLARAGPLDSQRCARYALVMVIAGVLHGLSNAAAMRGLAMEPSELVEALFFFNLGVDAIQVSAAMVLVLLAGFVRFPRVQDMARVAVGGVSFGLLLISLVNGEISHPSGRQTRPSADSFELPGAQMVLPGSGNRLQPPKNLRHPIACFLTVEPYETRLEVLVRLEAAREWIDLVRERTEIEIDQQQPLKEAVVDLVADRVRVEIDRDAPDPDLRRADFVTVEPTGIFSRPKAIVEPVDQAIVGVTFVFETADMTDEIMIDWSLFGSEVTSVPATATDPFGGRQQALTPEQPELFWKSRWTGYQPPEIQPVVVDGPRFPLVSIVLLVVAAAWWYRRREKVSRLGQVVIVGALTLAYVAYPFARVSTAASFAPAWEPSAEQAADVIERLLTNVYRAYDMRHEEAIYDRLAVTVTGEQLTEIYLDTRRSLELENRGGARAKVDQVDVHQVHAIETAEAGGWKVDVSWTVSGSVTHFGHTHYRRNRYRAVVSIVPVEQTWKITSIQVAEQQRLL